MVINRIALMIGGRVAYEPQYSLSEMFILAVLCTFTLL